MYVVYRFSPVTGKWEPVVDGKHQTYGQAIAHAWELKQYNPNHQYDVNFHASRKKSKKRA